MGTQKNIVRFILANGLAAVLVLVALWFGARAVLSTLVPAEQIEVSAYYRPFDTPRPLSNRTFLEVLSWEFDIERDPARWGAPTHYYDAREFNPAKHSGGWVILVLGILTESEIDLRTAEYLTQLKENVGDRAEVWFARMNRKSAAFGLWSWHLEKKCGEGQCFDKFLYGAANSSLEYDQAKEWVRINFSPRWDTRRVDQLPIIAVIDSQGRVRTSWGNGAKPIAPELVAAVTSELQGNTVELRTARSLAPSMRDYFRTFSPCLLVGGCDDSAIERMIERHGSFRGEINSH